MQAVFCFQKKKIVKGEKPCRNKTNEKIEGFVAANRPVHTVVRRDEKSRVKVRLCKKKKDMNPRKVRQITLQGIK
jgi:hypothetical protein